MLHNCACSTAALLIYLLFQQANANLNDLAKRLKQAETMAGDYQRRAEELQLELQNANGENQRINAELTRLRALAQELQDKNDALARENKQLSGRDSFCTILF